MCVISEKATSCNNIILRISKLVQSVFNEYRQIKKDDLEGCGVLIGNHKIDGNTICVNYATKPQDKDIRRRYSYKMDAAIHQNILEKYFNSSNNEEVYLGTWHSHPEKNPNPSNEDFNDWKKQYQLNKKLFNRMIFIIVGISKTRFWLIENEIVFELKKKEIEYD
jgi:integrative and conjugative element protein (TIGR02256 family)